MTVPENPPCSESCRFDPIHITLMMTCSNMRVTDLRRQTCCFLKTLALCAEDIYDIELIVSELVTNAVVHAHASSCRVDIDIEPAQVIITVTDDGRGFDPNHIPCPGARRPDTICPLDSIGSACTRVGGYGLPLVRSLSQSLDIVPCDGCGAKVRVTKNLCHIFPEHIGGETGVVAPPS